MGEIVGVGILLRYLCVMGTLCFEKKGEIVVKSVCAMSSPVCALPFFFLRIVGKGGWIRKSNDANKNQKKIAKNKCTPSITGGKIASNHVGVGRVLG